MSCEPLVLRGDAAVAARPVVFGVEPSPAEVMATGPWADVYAEVRDAAHRQGYQEGLEQGRRAGEARAGEDLAARAAAALGALDLAVDRMARVEATSAGQIAPTVVELALELAELILQRELSASAEPARDALARALPLVPDRGALVVRLHPADCRGLGSVEGLVPGRDVTVVPDPAVANGDAVVDVGPCRVESRLDEALARVARALRGAEVTP